jgi:hypothetical protein
MKFQKKFTNPITPNKPAISILEFAIPFAGQL